MRIVIDSKDKVSAVRLVDNEFEVRQPTHLPEPIIEIEKSILAARQNFSFARVYITNGDGLTARFHLNMWVNAVGQVSMEVIANVNNGEDTKKISKHVTASFQE